MATIYDDATIDPGPGETGSLTMPAAQKAVASGALSAELPGVPESLVRALRLQAAIREQLRAAPGWQAVGSHSLAKQLTDEVMAGTREVPTAAELGELALAAHLEAEAAKRGHEVLAGISTLLAGKVGYGKAVPGVLAALRDQLVPLLAEVREAAAVLRGLALDDPASVAGATPAQRKALQALPGLSLRYNRLRMWQRVTLVAGREDPVSAAFELASSWTRDVFAHGLHEFRHVTPATPGPSPDLPGVARLLALARRDDVWLPTVKELAESVVTFHEAKRRATAEAIAGVNQRKPMDDSTPRLARQSVRV